MCSFTTTQRELGELRKQNQEARSLKDGGSPEYDQKMQILQAMRKERGDKKRLMGEITANLKGLDAKSEQELDNKIKDMEHKMTHEGVPITEERKMVQLISKLNTQRERVSCSSTYMAPTKDRVDRCARYHTRIIWHSAAAASKPASCCRPGRFGPCCLLASSLARTLLASSLASTVSTAC